MATSGRTVAFSGVAVATGLAGLLFFHGSYLVPMAVGGIVVVVLAVVFALTVLPALLAVLGPRIHWGRLPLLRVAPREGFWRRTATWVMQRPIHILVPTLSALLLMGVPFLHLRVAAADVRVLADTVEARRGYELLRRDFPEQAATRATIAVRFPTSPVFTEPRVGALFDLSLRIAALPHVRKVESLVDADAAMSKEDYQEMLVYPMPAYAKILDTAKKMTASDRVVLLNAVVDAAPASEEARAVVRAIRKDRQVGDGTLLVGGPTANDVDTTAFVVSRAPRAIAFVVTAMLVTLVVMLRSVLLPVKAVLMNFVSVTGSFGALVWIFQDGHLVTVEPRPLEPALPVLLFCVLFGLSMDYEVLMLLRIKEVYRQTGDNTKAVADGLEKTAGLITGAAAIMVTVFTAFALARVVLIQAVGIGMALAVALDASLVRVLLVPSTMPLRPPQLVGAPPEHVAASEPRAHPS